MSNGRHKGGSSYALFVRVAARRSNWINRSLVSLQSGMLTGRAGWSACPVRGISSDTNIWGHQIGECSLPGGAKILPRRPAAGKGRS